MKKGLSFVVALTVCFGGLLSTDSVLSTANNVITASETEDEYGVYYNYSSGNKGKVSSFFATKLIECHSGDKISIENAADGHICFYDSNKAYISGTLINQTWNGITYDNTFDVPDNCVYFRLSTRIANKELLNIQVFENSDNDTTNFENSDHDTNDLENTDNDLTETENTDNGLSNNENSDSNSIYKYIVAADGSGNFTTVSDAVNNATSGDAIYIKSGIYEETIDLGAKILHLVGESRVNTIIYNTTGEYTHNPITLGAGILEELTIYAKNEDSHPVGHLAYAVHVERDSLYNNSLVIKNCVLKSDFNAALGLGMRGNCNVLFENDDFINTVNDRALYFHDADNNTKTGIQRITVRNCRLKVEGNAHAILHMQSQEKSDSMVYVTFQNNKLFSKSGSTDIRYTNWYNGNSINEEDFGGLINWRLTDDSYGNSLDVLNY